MDMVLQRSQMEHKCVAQASVESDAVTLPEGGDISENFSDLDSVSKTITYKNKLMWESLHQPVHVFSTQMRNEQQNRETALKKRDAASRPEGGVGESCGA